MSADTYALADHIRVCRTVFDTVGLDLKRGRYFALGEPETLALASLGILPNEASESLLHTQHAHHTRSSVIAALVSAGLLQTNARPATRIVLPTPAASAGYEHMEVRRCHFGDLRAVFSAHRWARRALAERTLQEIVHQAGSAQRLASDRNELIIVTNVFRRMRPYLYSARGRCLLHALTLYRFLHLQGLSAHWVMAVRTRPWAAHSWVQADDCVLDARCDDVREYAPLLVV
jgi:hypothetical protein